MQEEERIEESHGIFIGEVTASREPKKLEGPDLEAGGGIGNPLKGGELEVSKLCTWKKFEHLLVIVLLEDPARSYRKSVRKTDRYLEPFQRYQLSKVDAISRESSKV